MGSESGEGDRLLAAAEASRMMTLPADVADGLSRVGGRAAVRRTRHLAVLIVGSVSFQALVGGNRRGTPCSSQTCSACVSTWGGRRCSDGTPSWGVAFTR